MTQESKKNTTTPVKTEGPHHKQQHPAPTESKFATQEIAMDSFATEKNAFDNRETWKKQHIAFVLQEFESALRDVVFSFLDDFKKQTKDYEMHLLDTIYKMEPSLAQTLTPSMDALNVKRNDLLDAESFLQGLATSSWTNVDDRALILENLILHSRGSFVVSGYLQKLLAGLDSATFIKEKQMSLERVLGLVLKLRSRIQKLVDIGIQPASMHANVPLVDVYQDGLNIVIKMYFPGIKSKDFDKEKICCHVSQDGWKLEMAGEFPSEHFEFHLREMPSGKFYRTVDLPCSIQDKPMETTFQDGIMMMKFKKAGSVPIQMA